MKNFLVALSSPAREAAAVLLQPLLTQLLPACLAPAEAEVQEAVRAAEEQARLASSGITWPLPPSRPKQPPAACLVHFAGALHVLLGTGAAAAQLHKTYVSHAQQVCQGLGAALRFMPLHAVTGSSGATATLVGVACSFMSSKPGSSSSDSDGSSSSSGERSECGPSAKQLFSLLVTCIKAAGRQVDSSSCSSSSDENSGSSANDANLPTLADILVSYGECFKVASASGCVAALLQLLLRGRCLSQLAKCVMLAQRRAAEHQATAAEQQGCDQEAAAEAADVAALLTSRQQQEAMTAALQQPLDVCMCSLDAADVQLLGDAAAAAKALTQLRQRGTSLQQQLQQYLGTLEQQAQQQQQGSNSMEPKGSRDGDCSSKQTDHAQVQRQGQHKQQQSEAQQRRPSSSSSSSVSDGSTSSMQDCQQQKDQQQQCFQG
uniref:Uncharacterized protein n=1 Tax=Tetradesmus obliquus TaxID=3088 RepID=A0A383VN84_TETOB|eukprot:jgi/Sobl393_1/1463/SZX66194.1